MHPTEYFSKFLISTFLLNFKLTNGLYNDYKTHECIRPCTSETAPKLCTYEWTVEWYSVLSLACLQCPFNKTDCNNQGCIPANGYPRPIMVVNRMLPGPSIIVCYQDIISVKLHNNLHFGEATTIHWHGIRQKKSPYMDGVNMITQCPIVAHTSFEYRFEADSTGTGFWHAHAGLQRSDGFFGPMVIHKYTHQNPHIKMYDFDLPEHVIIVNDWMNSTMIEKFADFHHNDGDSSPRSILINGKGVLQKMYNSDGKVFQTPRAVFTVESGKRYRFRIINAGILYCPIEISIDSHNLTVISSDGSDVEPYEVESLVIMAGERFDFVMNASQTIRNYWLKAKGHASCSTFKVFQTGIISYKGAKSGENLSESELVYDTMSRKGLQLNPLNRMIDNSNRNLYTSVDELKSVEADSDQEYRKILNSKDVKVHYLSMEVNKINNPEFNDEKFYPLHMMKPNLRQSYYTPQINNISLKTPEFPLLYTWHNIPKEKMCNEEKKSHVCPANQTYCSCLYTYEFEVNQVVEFVIVDEAFTYIRSNHPMHLHGGRYVVLGIEKLNKSLSMSTVKEMDKLGLLKRNFDRPPIKDTTTVPAGGYTIIRFLANNPGTWMFHCHLEFHSEVGMAILIKVGDRKDLPPMPRNWPQCGSYEWEGSTGNILFKSLNHQVISLILWFMFFYSEF